MLISLYFYLFVLSFSTGILCGRLCSYLRVFLRTTLTVEYWCCRSCRSSCWRWLSLVAWRWSFWRCGWRRSSQRPCRTSRQLGRVSAGILGQVGALHDLVALTDPISSSYSLTIKISSLVSVSHLVTVF